VSTASRRLLAYAVATLAALAGLAITELSVTLLAGPFFMFQFAAVVGAALYGGLGPGLLTMALSGVGTFAMFYAPALEAYEVYRLASFTLVSSFFALLAARMRHARVVAEEARVRAEAAERKATAIGAQQERLVAVVGHDLRSPLNAITATADQLQRLGMASEQQSQGLSRIMKSARRMQSLIQDLLDFARARHGSGLPVQRRPARLGDICRVALEEVRTAQPNGSVLLAVEGDDEATLDPARVEQVVCNLVTNALQHGAPDAPVTVKVAGDGVGVRLEVTNQGRPIPPDQVDDLFEPFRTGDATASIGLGLFIVREVARAHGGAVSVRSDSQQTTFTVALPRGSRGSAPAGA
jgi:signal transduction histidine kinase